MSTRVKLAYWSVTLGSVALASFGGCQVELLKTEDPTTTVGGVTTNGGAGAPGTTGGAGAPGSGGGAGAPGTNTTGGPVFDGEWEAAVGDLKDEEFDCFLDYLTELPHEDALLAAVGHRGMFESKDGGKTWSSLGEGAEVIQNGPTSIVFDPEDPNVFYEAGIYGDSPYKTEDGGESFERVGEIGHTDHISIDFTDPDRQTMLAGTHENKEFFWLSTNGGAEWENIAARAPEECVFLNSPHVLDAETFLLGCQRGIARSDDAGETWKLVSEVGGLAPPLIAHDDAIYFKVEGGGIVRSDDQGKTWDEFETPPAGLINGSPPIELPDNRLAMLANNIMVVSDDRGETWEQVTPPLPEGLPNVPKGFLYSKYNRAFYVWSHSCERGFVGGDEIQRYDFDYEDD